jgi:inositol-phosphate phosphatase/L-galactose 1-phosphate phosphatase/histidinol-phosphatase
MPPAPLSELLSFAAALADLARPIARSHFRQLDAVASKADLTPVTLADRQIERALRARIAAAWPEHGVLGEEEGADRTDADYLWVLDPIDGTKAFASGNPLFGTLIGLMHAGRPVLGVLEAPALGERWTAARGLGAFHQGRRIRTRGTAKLDDAVLYCTTPDPMADHAGFTALRARVRWNSYGGDCCAYGFVAMGGADLVVDRGLKPYDWCALVPILAEAGGVLVDWQGKALHLGSDGAVVAAGRAELAAAAIAVLSA